MYPRDPFPDMEIVIPRVDDILVTGKTLIRHLDTFIHKLDVRAKAENKTQNRHHAAIRTAAFRLSLSLAVALLGGYVYEMPHWHWQPGTAIILSILAMFLAIDGYHQEFKIFDNATKLLAKDDNELADKWMFLKSAYDDYSATVLMIEIFIQDMRARYNVNVQFQHLALVNKLANMLERQKDSEVMKVASWATLSFWSKLFVTGRLQDLKKIVSEFVGIFEVMQTDHLEFDRMEVVRVAY